MPGFKYCGLLVLALAMQASAAEVFWITNPDEAWSAMERDSRPLLVYVTKPGCPYCVRMKATFAENRVANRLNGNFVPLVVDLKRDPAFVKELGVTKFPTTLVISPNARLLSRIEGYRAPEPLLEQLEVLTQKSMASQQRSSRH